MTVFGRLIFPYPERVLKPLLAFLLLTLSSTAYATTLNAFGGLNYAAPTDIRSGTDQRWTGLAAPIFGLSVELPLEALPLSFETGILLKSSKSDSVSGGSTTETTGSWTDIPLLIHYHFDPRLSLGAGGFWSFLRKGDAASPSESPDSGLLLDLRARIEIAPRIDLLIDARYLHGLGNLATTPGDTFNTRSVSVMAGGSFTFP